MPRPPAATAYVLPTAICDYHGSELWFMQTPAWEECESFHLRIEFPSTFPNPWPVPLTVEERRRWRDVRMSVRIEADAEPIPGYRLIERIGGGGFGEVWKATAPGGLHKAIKFVTSDLNSLGDTGQRAEQELKALNRVKDVRHPYILSLER